MSRRIPSLCARGTRWKLVRSCPCRSKSRRDIDRPMGSLRPVSVGRWVAARSVAVQTEPHVNWRGAAVVPRHVPLATVADAFDAEVPVSGEKGVLRIRRPIDGPRVIDVEVRDRCPLSQSFSSLGMNPRGQSDRQQCVELGGKATAGRDSHLSQPIGLLFQESKTPINPGRSHNSKRPRHCRWAIETCPRHRSTASSRAQHRSTASHR